MVEYSIWTNTDKKKYLDPYDFDYGNKFQESLVRQIEVRFALYELLAADWKGCRIGWIGDECLIPENYDMTFFDLLREDSKKCENVTTDVLLRICKALDCQLEDIVEKVSVKKID